MKAVVFDLYGTLLEITQKTTPFSKFARLSPLGKRVAAEIIMTRNETLSEILRAIEVDFSEDDIHELEQSIRIEIESIRLFDDTIGVLDRLHSHGVKIGVCSNLAKPYGKVLEMLPSKFISATSMSYEVGKCKPERLIYADICNKLGVSPHECVMIGDTPEADVKGPMQFGMQGILLDRKRKHQFSGLRKVCSLNEFLLTFFKR